MYVSVASQFAWLIPGGLEILVPGISWRSPTPGNGSDSAIDAVGNNSATIVSTPIETELDLNFPM